MILVINRLQDRFGIGWEVWSTTVRQGMLRGGLCHVGDDNYYEITHFDLSYFSGKSIGSYTVSHGIEHIRRHVAEFIERRDGHPARWEDICLSAGASSAIKNCLQLLCNDIGGKNSGVCQINPYALSSLFCE